MDAEITFRSEQRLTQDEFFEWLQHRPAGDVHHYELIQGRIVMTPPADFRHGTLDSWLSHKLWQHVEPRQLGLVQGSSTGYELPSGDTLEPDVSFVSSQRLKDASSELRLDRFGRVVPDFVVEILSPSTASRDRGVKKEIYAANGVREYWILDPRKQSLTVFCSRDGRFDAGTTLSSGPIPSEVFPDLVLSVEEVFRKPTSPAAQS